VYPTLASNPAQDAKTEHGERNGVMQEKLGVKTNRLEEI